MGQLSEGCRSWTNRGLEGEKRKKKEGNRGLEEGERTKKEGK